jgi:hypothetical protein
MKRPLTRQCGTGTMGPMTHQLTGEKLLAIQQPDLFWKQVYITGDKAPLYFRAEIETPDIVIALAEEGVDVADFCKTLRERLQ